MRFELTCALLLLVAPPTHAQTVTLDFPVPTVTIHANEAITHDNLVDRRMVVNASSARSFHTSRDQIVGKVAKRVLPAGAAVPVSALREPFVFKDGERVALYFTSGGLTIRGSGLALEPGVVGRAARVRNVDTGVVVSGTVQPDGSIELGGS